MQHRPSVKKIGRGSDGTSRTFGWQRRFGRQGGATPHFAWPRHDFRCKLSRLVPREREIGRFLLAGLKSTYPLDEVWPSPPLKKKNPPDVGSAIAFSKFTISGALGFPEVVGPIYDEINGKYGTDYEPIFKE